MPKKRVEPIVGFSAKAFLVGLAWIAYSLPGFTQAVDPSIYSELEYRHIGPQGNRVIAVVGVPGDPSVYYAGAPSGGIWKTTDGGTRWKPIFDDQKVASIGSLAIAPSDSNIVWAGTGETFIRTSVSQGDGIYKSEDGGTTWKNMGLEKTGRIGRVLIHPKDPNIVYAAAMGHCYGPQQERGVFRTTDGGETWEHILFVDENTGCSDLAIDPNNSRILFAGMWQMLIRTWGRWSGGPGSGLHVSRDGGTTWERLTDNGLPDSEMGKIAVAIAPSNSDRVYALIESHEGVLWRSNDGGKKWQLINKDIQLIGRPLYYTRFGIAPDNPNELYFLHASFVASLDGGETFKTVPRAQAPGGDNHDIWFDPQVPDRIIVGNDNPGVSISVNRGRTWDHIRLPIAQMYHVAVDNQIPYYVYGNRQDGPSNRGPSNSLLARDGIPSGLWHSVGGGEAGFTVPDPVDNNIIWSGEYDGILTRFDLRTGHARSVNVWPEGPNSWAAGDVKYRFQWTFPIAVSPHDHNKVYVGSQHVHQTTNGGQSWTIISPDLSTNDKSKQERTGGLTPDDSSPTYACSVFAIAESTLEEGLIWAGTNDGLLHVTRDGGLHWENVTDNIPDLLPWGTVSNIEPSRFSAGTCYVTFDFHQVNHREPFVFGTKDYGKSWDLISDGIPKSDLSYAHCVREDPIRQGMLYLGTENAIYVTYNEGDDWYPLQNNLPHAPVHWLTIQEHFRDLVVGTYGRGFWILDDITPIRELDAEVLESEAHLFEPRTTYRFLNKPTPMSDPDDQCSGENPPYGVPISYYLKSEPEGEVILTIVDEAGQTVRALGNEEELEENRQGERPDRVTKKSGLNRVWWDLRYDPTRKIRLRTRPEGSPHVTLGPEGWRPYGGRRGRSPRAPKVVPGTYTVRLTVGERELTQKLTVKKDPHSDGTDADIQAQGKTLLAIRDDINSIADMINEIEWIRKQINDLQELLREEETAEAILTESTELDDKLKSVENEFFDLRLAWAGQDTLRWPDKLHTRLAKLAGWIEQSDYPPTTQQIEVYEHMKAQLVGHTSRYRQLVEKELADFNERLRQENISHIVVVAKK
jgi:photosystem II stability/assembly factor-like uncharacterized protein